MVTIWIMRIGLIAIVTEVILLNPGSIAKDLFIVISLPLLCAMLIIGAEFLNLMLKRGASEARITRTGIEIKPPTLYFGRRVGKPFTSSIQDIIRIELVRSRDAPQTAWANPPEGGWPITLAFTTKDGKLHSLSGREPCETLRAVDFIASTWGKEVEDAAFSKSKPQKVYGQFVNARKDSWDTVIFAMFAVMASAFLYQALDTLTSHSNSPMKFFVVAILLGMIVFLIVMFFIYYKMTRSLKSVVVKSDGLELRFKSSSKTISWSELKEVSIASPDHIGRASSRGATIRIGKRSRFQVTEEIGKAVQIAYGASKGLDYAATPPPQTKPGMLTSTETTNLKYHNPKLYRRMILVSVALFANSMFFIFAIILESILVTMIGVIVMVVLLYIQMSTRKEITRVTERERARQNGGFL